MSLRKQWLLSILILLVTTAWWVSREPGSQPFDGAAARSQPAAAPAAVPSGTPSATPVETIPSTASPSAAAPTKADPAASETPGLFPEVTNHALPTTRLRPAVRASTSGPHAFLQTDPDGSPVTWSPCTPIHYAVNPAEMPANGMQVLHAAIDEISAATGLTFVQDPDTRAVPWRDGEDLDRTAEALFPPVLVDWATDKEFPPLTGHGGVASPFPFVVTNAPKPIAHQYVSGQVTLSASVFQMLSDRGEVEGERGLLVHELGHLVGLGHVNDASEIMNPTVIVTHLGPGDLQGLAEAGSGHCTF